MPLTNLSENYLSLSNSKKATRASTALGKKGRVNPYYSQSLLLAEVIKVLVNFLWFINSTSTN